MALTVQSYVARLLTAYENATGETHSKIAWDKDRPEVLIETTEWSLPQLMEATAPDEEKAFVLF